MTQGTRTKKKTASPAKNSLSFLDPVIARAIGEPTTSPAAAKAAITAARVKFSKTLSHLRESYSGGLPAERQFAVAGRKALLKESRQAARRAWCAATGRPIGLLEILHQHWQQDGKKVPRWVLADPLYSVDRYNGAVVNGQFSVGSNGHYVQLLDYPWRDGDRFVAKGFPYLPAAVRRLATNKTIRRRARWVGVLYQPDQWQIIEPERHPDPALVVEWMNRPGEYYALAVWGGDRAQIMEFVS